MADYDAAAIRTVFGFLRRAEELGCLRNSISIGKREVPAAPPPKLTLAERWKSRHRGKSAYPSTTNEYEHFEGHLISGRQRNAAHGDALPSMVHLAVWVYVSGVVAISGDLTRHTGHRDDPAIEPMYLNPSEGFEPHGDGFAGWVRTDTAAAGSLPFYCKPERRGSTDIHGFEEGPCRGRPKSQDEIDATLGWLSDATEQYLRDRDRRPGAV